LLPHIAGVGIAEQSHHNPKGYDMRLKRRHIAHLPITPLSKALRDDYERRKQCRLIAYTFAVIAAAEIVRLVVM